MEGLFFCNLLINKKLKLFFGECLKIGHAWNVGLRLP